MKNHAIQEISVKPDEPLSAAIARIEASGGEIALVVDDAGRLVGTITDGDIRRGILKGMTIDSAASEIMHKSPRMATLSTPRSEIAERLHKDNLFQMPIVNDEGVVIDIVYAEELVRPEPGLHPVVIMAGGLGTRLHPITETIPKPMIPVGGRPILEVIIERFQQQGFTSITLCVNHLAEMIQDYFEDGAKFGVDISYVRENQRMGTAGALSLLEKRPLYPVIVMNGDILTLVNFSQLLSYHYENNALVTMGLNKYNYQLPYGVVETDRHLIKSFVEKPKYEFFVNAGIYVVSPDAIDLIPKGTFYDMPTLFEEVPVSQRVAFPLHEYWLDIGRHDDLDKADSEYARYFPRQTAKAV